MKLDKELCISCMSCLPYCPMEAISAKGNEVSIDNEKCVDCSVCLNSEICPVDAFVFEEAPWPRAVRHEFSYPGAGHKSSTGSGGRGTEEMKTNDVTGRFQRGWVGLACEFGRPGTGAYFRDIEKVALALAKVGVEFEPNNPVTYLMTDKKTGKFQEDVLNEKVLTAILESKMPIEKLETVLTVLKEAAKACDTVFSVAVINKAEPDGSYPPLPILQKMGIPYYPNGKQNIGLGRPLAKF